MQNMLVLMCPILILGLSHSPLLNPYRCWFFFIFRQHLFEANAKESNKLHLELKNSSLGFFVPNRNFLKPVRMSVPIPCPPASETSRDANEFYRAAAVHISHLKYCIHGFLGTASWQRGTVHPLAPGRLRVPHLSRLPPRCHHS